MIQELIPGDGMAQFSYAAVWDRGKPIASLVAQRRRQYPVEFGFTSTFVETVEQTQIEADAFRFLASLDYSGPVEIEFKYDARDGRYKILDVNARAWAWIASARPPASTFRRCSGASRQAKRSPCLRPLRGRLALFLPRSGGVCSAKCSPADFRLSAYLRSFRRPLAGCFRLGRSAAGIGRHAAQRRPRRRRWLARRNRAARRPCTPQNCTLDGRLIRRRAA